MSEVDIKDGEQGEEGDGADESATQEMTALELGPLEELTIERDKLKDQLLRTAADFDNFRKRTKKDLELAERRGREETLGEILPVIDNLERAVAAGRNASDVQAILQGVEMVLKLFDDTAKRLGLERVPTVGERFDPALHHAVQQTETDEHPPGTIIAEFQAGYRLGDRLVRPAMVVVARKAPGGDG